MKPTIIHTKRLTLRPFRAEDAPSLCRIVSEAFIQKWMPDWPTTVEGCESVIQFFVGQYPLANSTTARVMFAMDFGGTLIGMTGIGNKEEVDNEIEIAYFISEAYAKMGYVTEAATAVSRWALQDLGLEYLMAIVETDNIPSQRVVEKCGFQKIDTRMILNSGESEEKPFYYYRLYPA